MLGVRLVFTEAGASLACGVMVFPLMVRAIRLSLEAIDPQLEQAARTLGARWLDRFTSITLPLAGTRRAGRRRARLHRERSASSAR